MKKINITISQMLTKTALICLLAANVFVASGQALTNSSEKKDLNEKTEKKSEAIISDLIDKTSSISTVNGDVIEKSTTFSIGNALYGLLPGLNVLQKSGEPGADDPDYRIRGNGTFGNSNYPLVLVDGIQRDFNSLSIEDIESVSVLKDASAAIIYGSKAANGVIFVKTKRGQKGKTTITANVLSGVQNPIGLPKFVSSADYAGMYNQALANDGKAPLYTTDQIDAYRAGDPIYAPNTDWIGELIRNNAPATRVNVNAKGGNDIVRYFASVGFLNQQGIYNKTDLHKGYNTNIDYSSINMRSNLDINITKDWTVKFDIFAQINDKNSPNRSTTDIWNSLYRYSSMVPMYVGPSMLGGTSAYPNNPMSNLNEQGYKNTHERTLISSLSTQYDLSKYIKGLVVGARYAYDNYYTVGDGMSKSNLSYAIPTKDPVTGNPVYALPFGSNTNLVYTGISGDTQSLRMSLEGFLNYDLIVNKNNKLSVSALYHQDKLTLGSESPYFNQSIGGNIGYALLDRYLLNVGVSYGGVEAFENEQRFDLFPAVSAAWVVSNETFLKDNPVISYLKLRGSYGVNGRSDLGLRFAYRNFYAYNSSYFIGTATSATGGVAENALGNPDVTYEKSAKTEVGVDLTLLKVINLSGSFYQNKRTGIIIDNGNNVPTILGVEIQDYNGGSAENSGVDLSLNVNKSYKDWGFTVGLNYSWMKSNISYNGALPVPVGSEYNYTAGHPISQPYGYEFDRFFTSDADIASSPKQLFGTVKAGDMKYKDLNNDGIINQYDRTAIASSTLPVSELGFMFGFNFKGFDIQGVLQSQLGRSIYLGSNSLVYWPLQGDGKISTYVAEQTPWTVDNQATANFPRLTTQTNPNNYQASDFWYKKADFVKLRSLEIGYNFSSKLIENAKMKSARLFLRGTNLLTLSDFSYGDPETMSGYPAMKTYNIGLKVQF